VRANWLLVALATAGCTSPTLDRSREYTGSYRSGFEASSFHPRGVKERWWLTGSVPCHGLNVGPDVDGFPAADWVHLSVRGTISEKGHYGHLGGYDRKLTVQRVLSCRSLLPGEGVEP
jgi:hypothetical protein